MVSPEIDKLPAYLPPPPVPQKTALVHHRPTTEERFWQEISALGLKIRKPQQGNPPQEGPPPPATPEPEHPPGIGPVHQGGCAPDKVVNYRLPGSPGCVDEQLYRKFVGATVTAEAGSTRPAATVTETQASSATAAPAASPTETAAPRPSPGPSTPTPVPAGGSITGARTAQAGGLKRRLEGGVDLVLRLQTPLQFLGSLAAAFGLRYWIRSRTQA